MNEHLPYEVIIAQKLQQLPPPDLADAIWARIEKQLDIDMPTDDGGSAPPSSPPGSGWIGGAALGVFVAAFIVVYLLLRNDKPNAPTAMPEQNVPATQAPAQVSDDSVRTAQPNSIIVRPPARNPLQPTAIPPPEVKISDSVVSNAPSAPTDSARVAPSVTQQQRPLKQDSVKPRRGVSGINDSDYRIVPSRKDSL